jgi:hypothetical protein
MDRGRSGMATNGGRGTYVAALFAGLSHTQPLTRSARFQLAQGRPLTFHRSSRAFLCCSNARFLRATTAAARSSGQE